MDSHNLQWIEIEDLSEGVIPTEFTEIEDLDKFLEDIGTAIISINNASLTTESPIVNGLKA